MLKHWDRKCPKFLRNTQPAGSSRALTPEALGNWAVLQLREKPSISCLSISSPPPPHTHHPAPPPSGSDSSSPITTGRVIGRFYGKDGLPTSELTQVEAMITKGLEANKQELKEKKKFPPCNTEWSSARGSRFWCSQTR